MSVVIRTDEEVMALQNEVSQAFDDGNSCASLAMEVLDYLTNEDAPKPQLS